MSTPDGQSPGPLTYAQFRTELFARHETTMAAAISTVGDLLLVGGPVVGVLARRWRVGAVGLAAGAFVTAAAHLFQRGTLRPELEAIVRHPLWATRAELERVAGSGR